MAINENSLAKLMALSVANPVTALMFDRLCAETYDEFIEVLYRDLEAIISKVQERKQLFFDSEEDPISMYIVDMLQERFYNVTHDSKMGGHIDIVVRGKDPSFVWLVEAKRDKGAKWIGSGFEQLSSRYSSGGYNHRHGCMLVYVQQKYAARIFKNWREHLPKLTQFEDMVISDGPRNPDLCFVSQHTHETSGLPYTVRHYAIALYHAPTV